jgi:sensor histidine kinase YesM
MSAPTLFLSSPRSKIIGNLLLAIMLIFIAMGSIPVVVSDWSSIHPFIYFEISLITAIYIGAVLLNIHLLIPRLLLRNKYVAYVCALFGMAAVLVLTGITFEWTLHTINHLPPTDYGYFAENAILFFDVLSNLVAYFISLIATSLIVFLQHWWKSGERIHELEETGVHVELEKARNRIDSEALFDVLNRAAGMVVSLPHEASRMLMDLSKSLRRQLYESDRKQVFSTLTSTEKPKHFFGEQHRLLNFLISKRHRLARNLLFVFALCVLGSSNVTPVNNFPYIELIVLVAVFLALIYFNVYVLLPRLLFKNKWKMYLAVITLIVIGFILFLMPSDLVKNMPTGIFIIYIISSIAQIGFMITGTTAFVLFQHWARNERYIAQLEAATMRAELEQLQNQINPHFLFNMLNNILVLIGENPEESVVIIHKMSDMLKYQFNDSAKKEVLLKDDVQFLTDFLNLEKIRRDRFEFSIAVENDVENQLVPPLLFIPFVENAVKHSADAVNLSYIRLYFSIIGNMLHFTCKNSKPLKPQKKSEFSGLGMVNIRRRLELLYDNDYSLDIQEDAFSYTVQLTIKL